MIQSNLNNNLSSGQTLKGGGRFAINVSQIPESQEYIHPFGGDADVVHQNSFHEDFILEPHSTNHVVEDSGYYLT